RVPLVFYTDAVPLDELEKHIESLDLWQQYMLVYPHTKKKQAIQWIVKRMRDQDAEAHIGIRLINSVIHQFFMKDI
ncbi:hypothetical protein OEK97_28685, partial [Escherichia coli]|uniref:hypothetical protein n=1 Tax=Escherichia coli TaxID=562 RepID=UPI0021DACBCC